MQALRNFRKRITLSLITVLLIGITGCGNSGVPGAEDPKALLLAAAEAHEQRDRDALKLLMPGKTEQQKQTAEAMADLFMTFLDLQDVFKRGADKFEGKDKFLEAMGPLGGILDTMSSPPFRVLAENGKVQIDGDRAKVTYKYEESEDKKSSLSYNMKLRKIDERWYFDMKDEDGKRMAPINNAIKSFIKPVGESIDKTSDIDELKKHLDPHLKALRDAMRSIHS